MSCDTGVMAVQNSDLPCLKINRTLMCILFMVPDASHHSSSSRQCLIRSDISTAVFYCTWSNLGAKWLAVGQDEDVLYSLSRCIWKIGDISNLHSSPGSPCSQLFIRSVSRANQFRTWSPACRATQSTCESPTVSPSPPPPPPLFR